MATPTLLLTRPRPQAERFAADCRAVLGDVEVVISPILRIEVRTGAVDLNEYGGVLLSSENGARALADVADVAGVRAWCVGDRTAKVAQALGMRAQSAAGDAGDLVAMVRRARPGCVLLHAHGANTRGDVAGRLAGAGMQVDSRVVYDQVEAGLSDEARAVLARGGDVVLPLFSPRSARLVGKAVEGAKARLAVVALSPAVAAAWDGPAAREVRVAAHPDAAHMVETIATIWSSFSG